MVKVGDIVLLPHGSIVRITETHVFQCKGITIFPKPGVYIDITEDVEPCTITQLQDECTRRRKDISRLRKEIDQLTEIMIDHAL